MAAKRRGLGRGKPRQAQDSAPEEEAVDGGSAGTEAAGGAEEPPKPPAAEAAVENLADLDVEVEVPTPNKLKLKSAVGGIRAAFGRAGFADPFDRDLGCRPGELQILGRSSDAPAPGAALTPSSSIVMNAYSAVTGLIQLDKLVFHAAKRGQTVHEGGIQLGKLRLDELGKGGTIVRPIAGITDSFNCFLINHVLVFLGDTGVEKVLLSVFNTKAGCILVVRRVIELCSRANVLRLNVLRLNACAGPDRRELARAGCIQGVKGGRVPQRQRVPEALHPDDELRLHHPHGRFGRSQTLHDAVRARELPHHQGGECRRA